MIVLMLSRYHRRITHGERTACDIYVDDRLVSKPDMVQESLWFQEFPIASSVVPVELAQEFETDEAAQWDLKGASATVVAGDAASWLRYQGGGRFRAGGTQRIASHDRRLSFDLDATSLGEDGSIVARLDSEGRRVELEIGRRDVRLTAPGIDRETVDVPAPLHGFHSRAVPMARRNCSPHATTSTEPN